MPRITVHRVTNRQKGRSSLQAFHAWLPAGLYQVRVGVRDIKSGKIGSAMQWIQVPKVTR